MGDGGARVYPAPTAMGLGVMLGHVVKQVACGSMHSMCIADDRVWVWGDGYGGEAFAGGVTVVRMQGVV